MPEATLRAFSDHGEVRTSLDERAAAAAEVLAAAAGEGVDLQAITSRLEREGVSAFCDSYRELLACIEAKVQSSERRRSP